MRPACRTPRDRRAAASRFGRPYLSLVRHAMPFLSPSTERPLESVGELLARRAAERPQQTAFVFLSEAGAGGEGEIAWTFSELDVKARSVAAAVSVQARPGDRAVLVFPPGLDFLAAYFGCLYAGVLPAPATYPKPRRPSQRLDAIVADCSPTLALTTADTLATLNLDEQSPAVRSLSWVAVDQCPAAPQFHPIACTRDDAAFLQYTSGSTSEPRGVVVTHGNLLHNLELIREGFGLPQASLDEPPGSGVFWLPAYHDMGLIGGILTPLYVGGTSYLLAPAAFLQRPLIWLETLSKTGAAISGAPNFAYELCVRKSTAEQRAALDLSSWRLAFCGAEPIDAATLTEFAEAFAPAGFRGDAFYPCYGLAEATLMVTGGAGHPLPRTIRADRSRLAANHLIASSNGDGQSLVSCGRPLGDQDVLVVDPAARESLPAGMVGEIWIRGASVASCYWRDDAAVQPEFNCAPSDADDAGSQPFGAKLADGRGPYLRTGDLGAFDNGELFVTGRLKDVIIIRGRNLYPQDIERTVQQAHAAVETGAAFSVGDPGHEELVVVHQVSREHRRDDMAPVIRAIRAAIVDEHEVDPQAIVLLRPAALPVTSSGKVQRSRCRDLFSGGDLAVLGQWSRPADDAQDSNGDSQNDEAAGGLPTPDFLDRAQSMSPEQLALEVQTWMLSWLGDKVEDDSPVLKPESTFAELGLDSLSAVELNLEFEQVLGVRLTPDAAWSHPTPAALSKHLAECMLGITSPNETTDSELADSWFASMDADVQR